MTVIKRWAAATAAGIAVLALATPALSNDRRPTPSAQPQVVITRPRPTLPPITPPPTLPMITIVSIGDSLTVGHGPNGTITNSYRSELTRLMTLTGQPHQWRVEALGGTKCSWWAQRINTIIDTHDPDLIFLNCGTNDTPTDNTAADYRTILAAADNRDVKIVASLTGVPDMKSETNKVRPYILTWMYETYLDIKSALADYPDVPFADFSRIPANIEWLQADGIHLTSRSEAGYAQLFYKAARQMMNWKTFAQLGITEMCGLNGSWPNDPWPIPDVDYLVCRYS